MIERRINMRTDFLIYDQPNIGIAYEFVTVIHICEQWNFIYFTNKMSLV